ncbi:hypothetical protein K505DRAFT_392623 [Melanomma pulvis-pyrius CBS 109.77]|uniref:Uncharacterized protein n=1 Tax=Melanomma pulvis-pyrius CBS 109.77 TaxID=1314802 RepID=A0A6A6XY19_9PLEO|nr:hypothetical protein K505DRAFT_392623 [Melanomma pulvis-pyrius CBS 109.77]
MYADSTLSYPILSYPILAHVALVIFEAGPLEDRWVWLDVHFPSRARDITRRCMRGKETQWTPCKGRLGGRFCTHDDTPLHGGGMGAGSSHTQPHACEDCSCFARAPRGDIAAAGTNGRKARLALGVWCVAQCCGCTTGGVVRTLCQSRASSNFSQSTWCVLNGKRGCERLYAADEAGMSSSGMEGWSDNWRHSSDSRFQAEQSRAKQASQKQHKALPYHGPPQSHRADDHE